MQKTDPSVYVGVASRLKKCHAQRISLNLSSQHAPTAFRQSVSMAMKAVRMTLRQPLSWKIICPMICLMLAATCYATTASAPCHAHLRLMHSYGEFGSMSNCAGRNEPGHLPKTHSSLPAATDGQTSNKKVYLRLTPS